MFRGLVLSCVLIGGVRQRDPLTRRSPYQQAADKAPIEDDLVGSGFELCEPRLARHALKRLGAIRPRAAIGGAAKAIWAARYELGHREPGLGAALAAAFPRLRRDDVVGTMIRSGDSIRFNGTMC